MVRRWTEDEDKQIVELYATGLHCRLVGEKIGRPQGSVWQRLRELGVKMRTRSQAKTLSNPKGKDSPCYKTGHRPDGYKVRRSKGKNILYHREVAESVLGRTLTKKEVVHHVDDNKSNNDPKNLWVFPNQSAHWKYHRTGVVHPETIKLGEDDVPFGL